MNVVRAKTGPASRQKRPAPRRWPLLASLATLFVLTTIWYDWNYGRLGFMAPQPVIDSSAGGRIIRVPPGGNVQYAIEQANSGDVVELQAGAVYNGTVNLPNKPLTDFVTIRSSAALSLPPDKRVTPAQGAAMATITSGMLGRPAVQASSGAHHYRFVGIEFTATGRTFNYGVIVFGGKESRPENLPHSIEIDRCYVHPVGTTVSRRGIALNSADTVVKNSYIRGFGFPGEETQGICGWTGTRNVKIVNNYIEGGAENIMFGGADPAIAELVPQDIEVRGNHLNKPAEWNGKATVKTLFEIKNAKRVQLIGNLLTNNWKGSAFRITVRNQDGGAPFSTIEDVMIRDNIVDGAGEGVNILGKDDNYPSQTLKTLTIENNLLLGLQGERAGFEGSGYFLQIADGEAITVAHNTVENMGNIATFYGQMPRDLGIRENIVGHGHYGVHGIDISAEAARAIFRDNIFINFNRVGREDLSFPVGNTLVGSLIEAGITDLSERSRSGGVGCDITSFPDELRNYLRTRR